MNAPCYGCTSRSQTCHSSCEKYEAFKKLREADRAGKDEARRTSYYPKRRRTITSPERRMK